MERGCASSAAYSDKLRRAHDNQYGFEVEAPLWPGSHFLLETNQQKTRGMVNGNVLVPLPSERTPLATDPALRDYIRRVLNSYPYETPNRTDIDPRDVEHQFPPARGRAGLKHAI